MEHSLTQAKAFAPIVVAVVGMSGSGKSLVVERLAKMLDARIVYFGGVVIDELKARGLPVTEDNEARVRLGLRKSIGMAAMAVKRMPDIEYALALGANVVIDGLYSYSELNYLKQKLNDRLQLIAVHAPLAARIRRLADRKIRPLTAAELVRRDRREIEDLEKGGPIALAEFHILNDGMIADLEWQIERVRAAIQSVQEEAH